MFENARRGKQARNFTTNAPKILDLKSSSEQIFSRKLPLGAPDVLRVVFFCANVNFLLFQMWAKTITFDLNQTVRSAFIKWNYPGYIDSIFLGGCHRLLQKKVKSRRVTCWRLSKSCCHYFKSFALGIWKCFSNFV